MAQRPSDVRIVDDLLRRALEDFPRQDLLRRRDAQGRWVPTSTEDFERRVDRLARGLASRGVRKGDRVALLSENRPAWAAMDFAVLRLGAILVPLHVVLIAEEVASLLEDAGPKVVCCSGDELAARVEQGGLPRSVEHRVRFDDGEREGWTALAAVEEEGQEASASPERPGPDDVATILFTSGTSGPPKGVMLTHDNLVQNVLAALQTMDVGPEDACLSFLPLSHVFERMAGHLSMIGGGAGVAYATGVDRVAAEVREVRPTILFGVPRFFEKVEEKALAAAAERGRVATALFRASRAAARRHARRTLAGRRPGLFTGLAYRLADRLVLGRVRERLGGRIRYLVSGGAPLSEEVAAFLHGAGLPVLEGYGLTESSPVVSLNTLEALRLGSVGRPLPGIEVRIGEGGEILTRSRCVMKGYWKKPEKTAEAIVDGWLHTGDVGKLDADGFLWITDRKKDLIVSATGKKVAPQPIETRLKRSPLVQDVCLVGERRKYVAALVVPDLDALRTFARRQGIDGADPEALLGHDRVRAAYQRAIDRVNRHLSAYEQVKRFALLEEPFSIESGELTPTLKVKRHTVEDRRRKEIDALYAADAP